MADNVLGAGSIQLGPGILGKEEFERQEQIRRTQGSSTGLGPGIIAAQDKFKRRAAEQEAAKLAAEQAAAATVPTPTDNFVDGPPLPLLEVGESFAGEDPPPDHPSLNESRKPFQAAATYNEIRAHLADNPGDWPAVLEAEAQRKEGTRPSVARLVLKVAPESKVKMPKDVHDALVEIAG